MPLLHPRSDRPRTRMAAEARRRECPHNGHQAGLCFGLCVPRDGVGDCGHLAAHALRGRTQLAILAHKRAAGAAARDT